MICIQIYLSEWLMRHVLKTYKVFEQGKLLDAVIHIVINFLHADQFVRFSLILCQLYFSIFRKPRRGLITVRLFIFTRAAKDWKAM